MVATPISKLFTEQSRIKEIVSSSGCLEGRDLSLDWEIPYELFHCDIQPIHKLKTSDWKHLEKIKENSSQLKLISFHIATCCDRPCLISKGFSQEGCI